MNNCMNKNEYEMSTALPLIMNLEGILALEMDEDINGVVSGCE